jgi:hypothetical protein
MQFDTNSENKNFVASVWRLYFHTAPIRRAGEGWEPSNKIMPFLSPTPKMSLTSPMTFPLTYSSTIFYLSFASNFVIPPPSRLKLIMSARLKREKSITFTFIGVCRLKLHSLKAPVLNITDLLTDLHKTVRGYKYILSKS